MKSICPFGFQECHFIVSDIGLTIRVSGYSHRAPHLAELVTHCLLSSSLPPPPPPSSSSSQGRDDSSSSCGGSSGSGNSGGGSSSSGSKSSSSSGSSNIFSDVAMVAMQLQQLKQKYSNALLKASSLASAARLLALKPLKVGAAEKLKVIEEFEMDSKKEFSSSKAANKRSKTDSSDQRKSVQILHV